MRLRFFSILFLLSALLISQTLDQQIQKLLEGDTQVSAVNLKQLQSEYRSDEPGLLFLEGLITLDGTEASEKFQRIVDKYPGSRYHAQALLRLAEYYYVNGLYVRSGDLLKQYARTYPNIGPVDIVHELLGNALTIAGSADSAVYYQQLLSKGKTPASGTPQEPEPIVESVKDWSVQAGVFSDRQNATRLSDTLNAAGFPARVDATRVGGKALFAVRVGNYESEAEARIVSLDIRSRVQLDAFVIHLQ